MSDALVVLASSPRPDPYFNIIGHNARHGVRTFVIACVEMSPEDAAALQLNINQLVKLLQDGTYSSLGNVERPKKAAPLKDLAPMTAFFADVKWSSLRFTYENVSDAELGQFLKDQRKIGASFDVTTCKNSALAGAVAWLVSRGGSPIHTLEIKRKLSHDEADLLPYLEPTDYSYVDLSRSGLIKSATRRVTAGTLSKARFWIIAVLIALGVAVATIWLPTWLATPLFAATATFATIVSAVSTFVRYSE